jgi:Protein of unknown function (DUF4240)
MDISEFWQLIEQSRSNSSECEEQAQRLFELLIKTPPKQIVEFDHHFTERLHEAYRWDLWAVAYIVNGGSSDDGFEYFRCWLIGQGQEYFEAALQDPEKAADNIVPGEEVECEDLLYVAARAYEELTGDEDMPGGEEPGPAAPAGNPWDEDEVETLFPALAEKFG